MLKVRRHTPSKHWGNIFKLNSITRQTCHSNVRTKKRHFRYAKDQETLESRKHRKAARGFCLKKTTLLCRNSQEYSRSTKISKTKTPMTIRWIDSMIENLKNLKEINSNWWSVKTLNTFELHSLKWFKN